MNDSIYSELKKFLADKVHIFQDENKQKDSKLRVRGELLQLTVKIRPPTGIKIWQNSVHNIRLVSGLSNIFQCSAGRPQLVQSNIVTITGLILLYKHLSNITIHTCEGIPSMHRNFMAL